MRFLTWGAGLYAAIGLLALSLLVAVWPEPPARPLVGSEGWATTEQVGRADFRHIPERARFVRRSLSDKGTLFRTWTPEAGVSPGVIVSPPFRAAPIMSVAITGSNVSASGEVAAYMTCDVHDERLEIFRGDVLSDVTEAIVEPGPEWCRGQARLHLESDDRYYNVGIGTVAEVSRISAWKQSAFALFPYLVVAFLLLGGIATLGVVAARALSLDSPAPLIGICAIGLAAMGLFFAYAVGPDWPLGLIFSAAVTGSLIALALKAWRRLQAAVAELVPTAGVWALTACGYFWIGAVASNGLLHWEPNFRFSPAWWSSDNALPWVFAEALRHNVDLTSLFGAWSPTDRPPLLAGIHLMVGDLFALLQIGNDGDWLRGAAYNAAAIVANSLWAPIFYTLLRLMFQLDARRAGLATLIAAAVPFFLFNSIYGWPKLLSAAFSGVAIWAAIDRNASEPLLRRSIVFGVACALALMSHGSAAMFLAPLAVYFLVARLWRSPAALAAGVAVGLALLMPWSLYQHFVIPSSGRLLTFALTGSFGGPEHSTWEAVRTYYSSLSVEAWLHAKAAMALQPLWPLWHGSIAQLIPQPPLGFSQIDLLRRWDFYFLSAGNAVLLILAGFAWMRPGPHSTTIRTLLILACAAYVLMVLILFAPVTLHHMAYAAPFTLALAGLGAAGLHSARLLGVVGACVAVYSGVVWVALPIQQALSMDVAALLGLALTLYLALRATLGPETVPAPRSDRRGFGGTLIKNLAGRVAPALSGVTRRFLPSNRTASTYPVYLRWIGAAALLIAGGVILKASLAHIFVVGNCCADDGYFSLIAKTLASNLQYGLPVSDQEVRAFDASIGSGPALILPGALAIALFGPQNWVPALTAFAMLIVQLAGFAWLLGKVYDKWRILTFMAVALLAIVATTRFHFYYMAYLGEGPALGFLLLGVACLVVQQTRPHYAYIAGLMFGLALLTKFMEAFTVAGALAVWFAYRLTAVRWRAFAEAARLSAALLAPLFLYEAIKFASLGAEGYARHWQYFLQFSDRIHARPEDVPAAVAHLVGAQYLLTWGSALFAAAMLGAAVYCFVRSKERSAALLPLMLFAAAGLHLGYSIFLSSLNPRYIWPGFMALNFALASPFLLLGARASAAAFAALLATYATPMSIVDYARFHDSHLRRQTLAERRVVLDFIAARSEAPVVSQWWGSFFEIAYLMDRGQRWRLTNDEHAVGDIDGPVVLNRHFMDRSAFYAAVSASCARHHSELTLYELYVCTRRYLPSASSLGEELEIRSVDLSDDAGARGWHERSGALASDVGWGTYTGRGDAGVGVVSIAVAVPADIREIAIPLVTGPVVEGLRYRVLGENDGEIALLAAPAGATQWRFWRVELPPSARLRRLRIEAEDRGVGWGQWAALGAPRAIGARRSDQGHRALSLPDLVGSAVGGAQHAAELIETPGPDGAPTPAIFAHAPMDLAASPAAGARELMVNFGMRAPSYASNPGTKGVCFSVDARLASGAVRQLWRRCLTPVEAAGDRGMQEAAIALPEGAQRLIFRTRPAVNGDLTWAWAYWAAPRVR